MKHGLGSTKPNALVWLPPALFYSADAQVAGNGQESQQVRGTARGGGAEAIFMLLSEREVSWRLKHTNEGGNR